jgi:iron complex outermembrane receptor protein
MLNNNFSGTMDGVTAWGSWRVSESWRLGASYVNQRQRFKAQPGTAPIGGAASLGNDPRQRASLSSSWDLGRNLELDVQVRRVGALPSPFVAAYTVLDARLGWHVTNDFELSLTGRNLGDPVHPEWGTAASRAELARSIFVKAQWRL